MNPPAVLYDCNLMHRRFETVSYIFSYRIFSLFLDIDRLEEINKSSRFFSVDRFNLFSFKPSDHLPAGETDLRAWVNRVLQLHGMDAQHLKVKLLCMPRVLGWGFDPLSIWYCETKEGDAVAAICEVHNTFGERHCYLLEAENSQWPIRNKQAKAFHVSPFIDVSGNYAFSLGRPGQKLKIAIQLSEQGQPVMSATQVGEARPFDSKNFLQFFLRIPFQTAKVLGAIHWHALKIWMRGAPFFHKPEPPLEEISK